MEREVYLYVLAVIKTVKVIFGWKCINENCNMQINKCTVNRNNADNDIWFYSTLYILKDISTGLVKLSPIK